MPAHTNGSAPNRQPLRRLSWLRWRTAAGVLPLLWLAACSHVFYAPNVANAPLLRESEIRVSGHAGGSSEIDWMAEGTVAVAWQEHLGVYGSAILAGGSARAVGLTRDRLQSGFGTAVDLGLGYHRHTRGGLGLEGIGGLQLGHGRNTSEDAWRATYSFVKPFAQLNTGYRGRLFEAVLAQRIGRLAYVGITETIVADPVPPPDSLTALLSTTPVVVYEPSVSVRAGRDPIKIGFDLGWTYPTTTTELRYDNLTVALGLYFTVRNR